MGVILRPPVATTSGARCVGRRVRLATRVPGRPADLGQLGSALSWSEGTKIAGDDFLPPQPSVSRIVKVVPASGSGHAYSPRTGGLPALRIACRDKSPATADCDHQTLIAQDAYCHTHRAASYPLLL